MSVTAGNSSVLTCTPKSGMTMVAWKISPKVGGPCSLGYRTDQNKIDKTNCSDSINWKFTPDWDPALEIRQVGTAHEGNYTCEVVAADGNFHETYHLTVLGKGLLPHFIVLPGTVAGPGHTKLLSPCTRGSVQGKVKVSCWDKLSCISLIVAPCLPSPCFPKLFFLLLPPFPPSSQKWQV